MNIRELAAKAIIVDEEQKKLDKARNRANHVTAAQMLVKSLLGIANAKVTRAGTWNPTERDSGEQWGAGAVIQLDDIYITVGHEWEDGRDVWGRKQYVPGKQCLFISTDIGLRALTNANIHSLADLGRDIEALDKKRIEDARFKKMAADRKAAADRAAGK